jgi:hypothetical protein
VVLFNCRLEFWLFAGRIIRRRLVLEEEGREEERKKERRKERMNERKKNTKT